jgi:hypothetical protein
LTCVGSEYPDMSCV